MYDNSTRRSAMVGPNSEPFIPTLIETTTTGETQHTSISTSSVRIIRRGGYEDNYEELRLSQGDNSEVDWSRVGYLDDEKRRLRRQYMILTLVTDCGNGQLVSSVWAIPHHKDSECYAFFQKKDQEAHNMNKEAFLTFVMGCTTKQPLAENPSGVAGVLGDKEMEGVFQHIFSYLCRYTPQHQN